MALSLASLPIEALEWITSVLQASTVSALLLCGDRVLNRKLMNGALRVFALDCTFSPWMTWPSNSFQQCRYITTVSIESSQLHMICPSMDLRKLPSNLTTLAIRTDDVFDHLRSQNIVFSDVTPSLTSLELEGKRLAADLLKGWPCELENLSLKDNRAVFDSTAFISNLPPHITSLRLLVGFKVGLGDTRWPSKLEKLELGEVEMEEGLFFAKLPSTLLELSLHSAYGSFWSESGDLCLPLHLASLTIREQTEATPHYFDLSALPPSLTYFFAPLIDHLDNSIMPRLPRNLKHLRGMSGPVSCRSLALGPPQLQSIDTDITVSSGEENLVQLVPNLTFIDIASFSGDMERLTFPPRLVELHLPLLDDDICSLLPPTLRVLKTRFGLITASGAAAIPKPLESFTMDPSLFADNDALLHLGHVSSIVWYDYNNAPLNFTAKCLQAMDIGPNGWREIAISFPSSRAMPLIDVAFGRSLGRLRNLVSLTLWVQDLEAFSLKSLDSLPPSLTSLTLKGLPKPLKKSHLRALPNTLQKLAIEWSPRYACPWDDKALGSLPRSLNTLYIAYSPPNITIEGMLRYLPPYLVVFRERTNVGPRAMPRHRTSRLPLRPPRGVDLAEMWGTVLRMRTSS